MTDDRPTDDRPTDAARPTAAHRPNGSGPAATALAEPTVDDDRVVELRAFLVREAAADATRAHRATRSPVPHRRLVGGLGVAVLLAAGLLTVNAVVGGPGPARVEPAVAITEEDGWTTVRLLDRDADPDDVLAQLEAGGIPAVQAKIRVGRAADGSPTVRPEDLQPVGDTRGQGATVVVVPEVISVADEPGDGGLVAFSVTRTGADLDTTGQGAEAVEDAARRDWEANGARVGADGSVSIRRGSGNTVVVYTAA